jgi:two-component system chemotaxis sensor kinase CheA
MDRLIFDLEPDEQPIFLADVDEHLHAMEAGVLRLEREAAPEVIDAIFRAAHTLKALASTIGHHQLAELTHAIETLFEALRDGRVASTHAATDDLLAAIDALATLRDEVVTRAHSDVDVAALAGRLRGLLTSEIREPATPASRIQVRPLSKKQLARAKQAMKAGLSLLEIEVHADPTAFAPAARLYQAAAALSEAGEVIAQAPSMNELGADTTLLWLIVATSAQSDTIAQIAHSVPDLAAIQAHPYTLDGATPAEPGALAPAHDLDKTVRISVERLDILMNLVGELVTDRTRLTQLTAALNEQQHSPTQLSALNELTEHLGQVVGQLQEEVMRVRMRPIASLFDKFPRLVRDTARAADKLVELRIAGATTELDRSIIDGLSDPLIHLMRNAIDHGIEPPDERNAAGKPATGVIRLSAAHGDGQIVLTVEDDGRGIDPQKIRRAAVARGLLHVDEAAQLDDEAVTDLIFWPQLSTAEQVTELSGRGVGMDIVRTHIERLNGSIVVESAPGRGATFRITVPLTLTIVPTMLVALGESIFAIPLATIVDMWSLAGLAVSTVKGSPTIQWRDSVLPLIELRQFFANPRLNGTPPSAKPAIVTVGWGKLRAGLVVDRIIGQEEIVAKTLSPIIGAVPGISGSATLGDGRIALIVDIPDLMKTILQDRR